MFISPAFAQAGRANGGPEAPDALLQLLPIILIFAVFYLLLIRPQRKRVKQQQLMQTQGWRLARGVTGGGLRREMTFYLAAAAYQNKRFCSQVLANVIEQHHTAIAPSYGIDLVTVANHCLRARRQLMIRNFLIAAVFFVPLISGTYAAAIGDMPFWPLVIQVLLSLAITFLVLVGDQLRIQDMICNPAFPYDYPVRGDSAVAVRQASVAKELEALAQFDSHKENVVVYGAFSPFIGAGMNIGGWSFSVNLLKPKEVLGEPATPKDFAVTDLYTSIQQDLEKQKIDNLEIEDQLFVNGRTIRNDRRFMPASASRPSRHVGPDIMKQYIANSTSTIRHYQRIKVMDLDGETAVTVFLSLESPLVTFMSRLTTLFWHLCR